MKKVNYNAIITECFYEVKYNEDQIDDGATSIVASRKYSHLASREFETIEEALEHFKEWYTCKIYKIEYDNAQNTLIAHQGRKKVNNFNDFIEPTSEDLLKFRNNEINLFDVSYQVSLQKIIREDDIDFENEFKKMCGEA